VIRNGDNPHAVTGWTVPGCGGSPLYVRHSPVPSWLAGKDGVGQEDCLPRARSKRDDVVTGRVALGRNETDAGNQLNLPLDNVDKVGVREQRQNSMWRVRNPGT
jgi:hypothetical protein